MSATHQSNNLPLRLLMVSEPGIDGVFSILNAIIRQILREHPEIIVDLAYSSRRSGPEHRDLIREIEHRGGKTIDLDVGNAPSPADCKALVKLLRFTKERGHQLVHAHSSKAGALARIARIIAPFSFPPVLYSPHAYYGMARLGTLKERFFDLIETILGRIGTTICCSEDEQIFAIERLQIPSSRICVIDNGIDTNLFSPADAHSRADARRMLGLPESGKLLATIGRDSMQKNYIPLYSVLESLLPSSNWSFSHAGAGSVKLRAMLNIGAQEKCYAFEHLSTIPLFLKAADGFVMTSRYEGLSLAMLQALSTGLPMFLTDAPGFRFLKHLGFDQISWLPDPEDSRALEQALRSSLAAWSALPSETLDVQRELVCRHFSQPVQIEKLITLYHQRA
jgi:glycosyltransferase involved in cell wall biosynthesis